MAIFQRRSNPPSYTDFQRYKPLLRADFSYRCAYCLLHEGDELAGGFHHFQIDHFRPKSHPAFKHLISNYSNLYYSCQWCNRAKWETWPSDSEKASGYEFVDPCKADLYLTHARLREDGKLESKTNAGEYSIREIRLNRRMFIKLRTRRVEAQAEIERTRRHIAQLSAEQPLHRALIDDLQDRITELTTRYINPQVPYEPEDLLVD